MHLSPLLPDVLWTAFALSVVAILSMGYVVADEISDNTSDAQTTATLTIAQLVAMGFLTCILALLGHSETALWAWRILNGLIVADSVLMYARSFSSSRLSSSRTKEVWLLVEATATVVLAALFSIASFLVRLPYVGAAVPAQVDSGPSVLVRLDFWHAALFAILAGAVLLCVVLFLMATQREGPLSFERNWGGLGGSTGGWEVSDSMTYLVGAVTLGALFLGLIIHDDGRQSPEQAAPVVATTSKVEPKVDSESAKAAKPAPSQKAESADKPSPTEKPTQAPAETAHAH